MWNRAEEDREELQIEVAQLPPARRSPREHNPRRTASDPRTPFSMGQSVREYRFSFNSVGLLILASMISSISTESMLIIIDSELISGGRRSPSTCLEGPTTRSRTTGELEFRSMRSSYSATSTVSSSRTRCGTCGCRD